MTGFSRAFRLGQLALVLGAFAIGARPGLDAADSAAPHPTSAGGKVARKRTPTVLVRPAPLLHFPGANPSAPGQPGECDSNSPLHWDGDTLFIFNSAGHPWRSSGADLEHLTRQHIRTEYDNQVPGGRWIECTWKADDGMLYGWYHLEPPAVCPEKPLTAPKIGAARSTDNGANWQDLGLVIEARPGTLNCDTKNFYFAGGNGDFCVMLDREQRSLYFFFSTYSCVEAEQGIGVARMRWADRDQPSGRVWKWYRGQYDQWGVGGRATPIFPARTDWHRADADAFWGPSVHWNSHLRQYVMLLNRAVDGNWTQGGVYVSFSKNLPNPGTWTPPEKVLGDLARDQWYPQVVGTDKARRETDKLAGHEARLFVRGRSEWTLEFLKPGEVRQAR